MKKYITVEKCGECEYCDWRFECLGPGGKIEGPVDLDTIHKDCPLNDLPDHNATIAAVIAKINLLLADVSRLIYEWEQSNTETSIRYKHRVEGVKRALVLIKSMKQGVKQPLQKNRENTT